MLMVTDTEVREFIGWLSGNIPELHSVEVPRLAESWERFCARKSQEKTMDETAKCDRPEPAANILGLQRAVAVDHGTDYCAAGAPAPPLVKVALSSHAAETLRCLFFHGPTWDGNVPSKSGRDELVNMGLVQRGNGWQWLTRAGVDACFANGIDREKERRESAERKRRAMLEDAARQLLG